MTPPPEQLTVQKDVPLAESPTVPVHMQETAAPAPQPEIKQESEKQPSRPTSQPTSTVRKTANDAMDTSDSEHEDEKDYFHGIPATILIMLGVYLSAFLVAMVST